MIGETQFAAIEALDARGSQYAKYFTGAAEWFRRAHQRAVALGLGAGPKRWILDVGTAVPYFAIAADLFGHNVLSLGPPDVLLERTAEILGCDYLPHIVTPKRPLPKLPHAFDLVTCFGVNVQDGDRDITITQCGQIVDEMIRVLHPGGRVILAPNHGWMKDRWRLVTRWRRALRSRARITNQNDWITFELK